MTTLIPIEHPGRGRRGLVLRRGARLGEASPLLGRSGESVDDVLRAVALGEAAPPSLDFALWSLDALRATTPIASQVLLENPRTALASAQAALALGHRAFKLKIRSASDADVLDELRALAHDAVIRVDANQSFARESLVPWDALARARVEWIEEPCREAGALVGTPVPIALDESVARSSERALDDLAAGRVRAIVLKPTVLGATATLRLARACRARGGRAIVSHAFESEIGRRAAEELARRIDPSEIHGLGTWDGIDAYRIATGGAPVATLFEPKERPRVAPALG